MGNGVNSTLQVELVMAYIRIFFIGGTLVRVHPTIPWNQGPSQKDRIVFQPSVFKRGTASLPLKSYTISTRKGKDVSSSKHHNFQGQTVKQWCHVVYISDFRNMLQWLEHSTKPMYPAGPTVTLEDLEDVLHHFRVGDANIFYVHLNTKQGVWMSVLKLDFDGLNDMLAIFCLNP